MAISSLPLFPTTAAGTPVPGGTAGSILFVDASGDLGQDNDDLFWDETNLRLGLGTNSPSTTLHVEGETLLAPSAVAAASAPVLQVTGAANTAQTASTELNDVYFNLARTVTFATGALTTQRAVLINAPTYAFVGASTLTNAVTVDVTAAPTVGTNATFTTPTALRVGGAATFASVAGLNYATIRVPAHTVTITGTTQVTASPAAAGLSIGTITLTDTSAVTVDVAAALYIAAAPVQAGSVALTKGWALWVDGGDVRLDGLLGIGTTATPVDDVEIVPSAAGRGVYLNGSSTGDLSPAFSARDSTNANVGWQAGLALATNHIIGGSVDGEAVVGGRANSALALGAGDAIRYRISTGGIFTAAATAAVSMIDNLAASSASASYLLNTTTTRTAGLLLTVQNNTTSAFSVGFGGATTVRQLAGQTGAPTVLTVTGTANTTAWTASTEAIDVAFDIGRTATFSTGTTATQRAFAVQAPTYAGSGGTATFTIAATMDIAGAPTEGASAAIVAAIGFRVGGASTQTSASGATYRTMQVPAHTITLTGTTQVTSAMYAAGLEINQVTLTDASAVTVNNAAALYIVAAPTVAGSVTVTTLDGIFVGGATTLASATAVNYNTIRIPAHTLTLTGTTQMTASPAVSALNIGVITATDASAITLDQVTAAVIASPTSAGSVTITTTEALRVGGASTVVSATAAAYSGINIPAHTVTVTGTTQMTGTPSIAGARVGAITITDASSITIDQVAGLFVSSPTAGGSAAITATYAVLAGAAATVASAAAAQYATIRVPAHTVTVSGSTNPTSAPGFAAVSLGQITMSNASIAVTTAATLYIAAAPVASGGGSITTTYALWVDAGNTKLDGTITVDGVSSFNDAGNAGSQLTEQNMGGGAFNILLVSKNLSNAGISFKSRRTASSALADFLFFNDEANRTAGLITDFQNNTASVFSVAYSGATTVTQLAIATGAPTILTLTGGANSTNWTASTEAIDVNINLDRTTTWATGALTTQRAVVVQRPSYDFAGASTITNAVTVDITGAPKSAGANATITNASALRIGGATTLVSATAVTYSLINVAAHTLTLTGTAQMTAAPAIAAVRIGQVTVSDASALTIDSATSLHVAAAPIEAGAGPAVFTSLSCILAGGATTQTAATGSQYAGIAVAAHTLTISGVTQVTSAPGVAGIRIAQVTSSGGTIDTGASLYIADATTGPTTNYAIWVDAGNVRLDGVVLNALGSSSAPSYSFNGDANTGIYSSAGDAIDFVTAGDAQSRFKIDANETAAETALLLSVAGAAPIRVSVDANDSGGAGFRALRVPNP